MKKSIIAIALALTATFAQSQTNPSKTGNELLDALRETSMTYYAGVAHGLIVGIAYNGSQVCTPPNVTNGQAVAVVKKFLEDTPSILHMPSKNLIYMALVQTFPCPKKENGRGA